MSSEAARDPAAHGGKISVRTELGMGSTFPLSLPPATPEAIPAIARPKKV